MNDLKETKIDAHTAWIDARHPNVNRILWGLTLLERNIRELHKLGVRTVVVATVSELNPLEHLCHPLPKELEVSLQIVPEEHAFAPLHTLLEEGEAAVIVIEGHALNDRRLLTKLLNSGGDLAVFPSFGANPGSAARVSRLAAKVFKTAGNTGLSQVLRSAVDQKVLASLDLDTFDPYLNNLRREIPPFILRVENDEQLREADVLLRQTVHKGVLEFVAKYIHPPLEFGTVRLIGRSEISPNQITIFWLILAALTIPLFMKGYLLTGIILAAISGVLDGVDGKLARLTLRFSRTGDLLDHVGGTVYDAVWYLALGWYFSGGDVHSTAAQFTYVLVISYLFHRIVPGLFRKVHGHEIYDYAEIDKFVRLIGGRMNNNIWLLLVGIVVGHAREAYYIVCIWMFVTAVWYIVRFLWVAVRRKVVGRPVQLTHLS